MQTKQDGRLGTEKIGKLMLELALPSVLAQIVNVLYNIVDRIYIGRIPDVGSLALTGVGVTFPIITIISAFAGFASGGGAPLAAIALGQKNRERAEKILGSSTSLLLFFSVLLMAFFFVFQTPLLYLFGASDNTIGYASTYISIYLVGTVFVELAVGLNTFISCQGHARTAMCSVLIGAVVNIGLDPVFIFVLHMGVSGAALATVLSQALSAAWVLQFLTSKKSGIRLSLRTMKPDFAILGSVMALGISPFIMSATESAITIVMNHGLQTYGSDLYVGSMTILQSVLQLIFVPVNGFTNGVQPIISYNFGAGVRERVIEAAQIALATAVVCGAALILTFLLSKPLRAYQLGEVYAQNLGVPLRAFRAALILLSSVLSACVTAFAGPISFVGIAVPHLMKSLFKSAEPLLMIPACFLGGGAFCLFCDLIARTAFAPTEVSISSVTAVFGAPVVIYMMLHRKGAQ